jgi:hypothetical protein
MGVTFRRDFATCASRRKTAPNSQGPQALIGRLVASVNLALGNTNAETPAPDSDAVAREGLCRRLRTAAAGHGPRGTARYAAGLAPHRSNRCQSAAFLTQSSVRGLESP